MDPLVRFSTAMLWSLAESAPYLVVGYFLVALVREFVPATTLTRYLGGHGAMPLVNALGIGSLLPVCSCGSIPLGIGLARSGAAVGTVLTLMTSAPAISPVSVVLGYTLLGPRLLFVFLATVLVGSFLLGLLANYWLRARPGEPSAAATPGEILPVDACEPLCADVRTPAADGGTALRLRRAARWAYWDLGADVSVDLMVGLTAAAAIMAFLPTEWITAWLGGNGTWAMLCVILVSIPLYTCSVPALLVIHSLLLAGASPGAAVAFLVAGPASNLGEINAIRGALGLRTALYYSACLVAVALVGGTIADQVVFRNHAYQVEAIDAPASLERNDAAVAATTELPAHRGLARVAAEVPMWHYPFMIVLAAVIGLGIVRRVQGRPADACS